MRERTFVDREIRTTTVDPEADDRVTAAWCHNLTFGCELLSPIDPKSVGEPTSCASPPSAPGSSEQVGSASGSSFRFRHHAHAVGRCGTRSVGRRCSVASTSSGRFAYCRSISARSSSSPWLTRVSRKSAPRQAVRGDPDRQIPALKPDLVKMGVLHLEYPLLDQETVA